ncbi:universal stress protein [Streptomyces sp. NPDC048560]|uniref:universal stress protein n=1 Tax=Streptomyces sp. NPDC048560 TaxID=3155488 RepID=UPI00343F31C9
MEPPLVAGVDGSEPSLRAADWAADQAQRHGLPLRLVHASVRKRYDRWEGRVLARYGEEGGGDLAV